jgi:hypothetical protein
VEQNRGSRHESTQLTIPNLFLKKGTKIYDGEKTTSSINAAGRSGYPSARN